MRETEYVTRLGFPSSNTTNAMSTFTPFVPQHPTRSNRAIGGKRFLWSVLHTRADCSVHGSSPAFRLGQIPLFTHLFPASSDLFPTTLGPPCSTIAQIMPDLDGNANPTLTLDTNQSDLLSLSQELMLTMPIGAEPQKDSPLTDIGTSPPPFEIPSLGKRGSEYESSELSDLGDDESEAETDKMDFLDDDSTTQDKVSDLQALSELTELARLRGVDSDDSDSDNSYGKLKLASPEQVDDMDVSSDIAGSMNGKRVLETLPESEEKRYKPNDALDIETGTPEPEHDSAEGLANELEQADRNLEKDEKDADEAVKDEELPAEDHEADEEHAHSTRAEEEDGTIEETKDDIDDDDNTNRSNADADTSTGSDSADLSAPSTETAPTETSNGHMGKIRPEKDDEVADEEDSLKQEEEEQLKQDEDDEDLKESDEEADETEDLDLDEHRKLAIEELVSIEEDFAHLRDKLYHDKLSLLEHELQLCLDGSHPELLQIYFKVNEFYQDNIKLANATLNYSLKCINTETIATRTAVHQDFLKQMMDMKNDMVTKTTLLWYKINKERNYLDQLVPDVNYAALPTVLEEPRGHYSLPIAPGGSSAEYYQDSPAISRKVAKQTALVELVQDRNTLDEQLGILNRLKEFVGIPCAVAAGLVDEPGEFPTQELLLRQATQEEINDDLRAMGIQS